MERVHRFEPLGHDLEGFWTSSSSIDWCERNYVVSWFIAEFWNSISAAIIFFCGAYGVFHAIQMQTERRFMFYGLSVMMVGVGTFTFHGSLTYIGQLGDELPMVWCMMVLIYTMMEMEVKVKLSLTLPTLLIGYSIVFSIIHAVGAFTRLFQLHFALLIIGTLYYAHKYVMKFPHPNLKALSLYYVGLWGVATIIWLFDQIFCERLHSLQIMNIHIPNPQFHAVWHILTGFCAHIGMVFVRVIRYMVLYDQKLKVFWIMGFWPTINDRPPKKGSILGAKGM